MHEQDAAHYKRHRFPPVIIGHAVWRYCRFALSYRNVEELPAERGVIVTYETVRQRCRTCGQAYANELRRRRSRPGDTWPLAAAFISSNGRQHSLRRAVDQDGHVLDILVQRHRNTAAAEKSFRRLLKDRAYVPRVVSTEKLACYRAAKREVMPSVEHRQHKRLNNRAEHAHQLTRERERRRRRFTRPGHAQWFLAAYGPSTAHFRPRCRRLIAAYRETRTARFQIWHAVTGTTVVA